jgi:hypothetical protein
MSRVFYKWKSTSPNNVLFPLQHFCTKMDHFYMQRKHNKHLHLALSSKHKVSCNHQDTVHYHATRSKMPSRHHSCCRHHQINLHLDRMHWYKDRRADPIVSHPYSFPIYSGASYSLFGDVSSIWGLRTSSSILSSIHSYTDLPHTGLQHTLSRTRTTRYK